MWWLSLQAKVEENKIQAKLPLTNNEGIKYIINSVKLWIKNGIKMLSKQ